MSVKEIRALERHFWDEWNKTKAAAMAAIDESYATNLLFHRGSGRVFHGLEDFKQYQSVFYKASASLMTKSRAKTHRLVQWFGRVTAEKCLLSRNEFLIREE